MVNLPRGQDVSGLHGVRSLFQGALLRLVRLNGLSVLRDVFPQQHQGVQDGEVLTKLKLPPGTVVLAADAAAEGKSIRDKVALVLTDLEMPVMDGFTLTRNIKQDQRFKGIPVIIHSPLTGTANDGHVKSVGADAYIAKFVAEELGATIREVLSQAK